MPSKPSQRRGVRSGKQEAQNNELLQPVMSDSDDDSEAIGTDECDAPVTKRHSMSSTQKGTGQNSSNMFSIFSFIFRWLMIAINVANIFLFATMAYSMKNSIHLDEKHPFKIAASFLNLGPSKDDIAKSTDTVDPKANAEPGSESEENATAMVLNVQGDSKYEAQILNTGKSKSCMGRTCIEKGNKITLDMTKIVEQQSKLKTELQILIKESQAVASQDNENLKTELTTQITTKVKAVKDDSETAIKTAKDGLEKKLKTDLEKESTGSLKSTKGISEQLDQKIKALEKKIKQNEDNMKAIEKSIKNRYVNGKHVVLYHPDNQSIANSIRKDFIDRGLNDSLWTEEVLIPNHENRKSGKIYKANDPEKKIKKAKGWKNWSAGQLVLDPNTVHTIKHESKSVTFISSIKHFDDLFDQIAYMTYLPTISPNFRVIMPYLTVGTAERITRYGTVPNVLSMAKLFSLLPPTSPYGGPSRVTIYDFHNLDASLYFQKNVVLELRSAMSLLTDKMEKIDKTKDSWVIVHPDAGAAVRFEEKFKDFGYTQQIVMGKKRLGLVDRISFPVRGLQYLNQFRDKGKYKNVKHVVVADDLTRSGGTLVTVMKTIGQHVKINENGGGQKPNFYTYITHGEYTDEKLENFTHDKITKCTEKYCAEEWIWDGNEEKRLPFNFKSVWWTDSYPFYGEKTKRAGPGGEEYEIMSIGPLVADLIEPLKEERDLKKDMMEFN